MSSSKKPVAIVTGASAGIGLSTARALAKAGYQVFGTSRQTRSNAGDSITMLPLDVTDDMSVARAVESVLAQTGRIDLLVNNAGVGLLAGAEESSIAQTRYLFDVNVFGAIRMTNAVLPTMRSQGKGRIVNLSSVLGLIPAPYSALYASTKHALEGYSESLDHEVRMFGIRIVLIEPAYTRTSFDSNLTAPDKPIAEYASARASTANLMNEVMKTADSPESVAATVVKAASALHPKRRYTSGKVARQVSFLRRFVPGSAFDKSLRKQLRLPAH